MKEHLCSEVAMEYPPLPTMHTASCGCIGLRTSEHYLIVLVPCDGEAEVNFFMRYMKEPITEALSMDRTKAILRLLQFTLAQGHRYGQLQRLLGLPVDRA
jgi:hypothetical protein